MFPGRAAICLCLALVIGVTTDVCARETSLPDILLIIADDLGAEVGCYGDPYVRTPHIDALAASGMLFENGWVAQASCSPSRGAIMTGLYPHQTGLVGLAHRGFSMDREYPTIPSLLGKAGYFTGVIGKVHIAPPPPFDFEVHQGSRKLQERDPRSYASKASDFLQAAGDRPIFLNVSFVDPHRPFPRQVEGQPADPLSGEDVNPLPYLPGLENSGTVKNDTADYYNCVMRVDEGVGLLLEELKRAGRLDDMLIIFIGDHGAPFSRAKTTCYHSGLQVPFIVKWPGVSKPGSASKALVSTVDILPTLLDAAGSDLTSVAGKTLRNVLQDPAHLHRQYLAAEHAAHLAQNFYPRRTIRNERYQLIHNLLHDQPNPENGVDNDTAWKAVMEKGEGTSQTRELLERLKNPPEYELYDLQNDPESLVNIAEDPGLDDVKQRLQAALVAWQDETSDTLRTRKDVLEYQEYAVEVIHRRATEGPKSRNRATTGSR